MDDIRMSFGSTLNVIKMAYFCNPASFQSTKATLLKLFYAENSLFNIL